MQYDLKVDASRCINIHRMLFFTVTLSHLQTFKVTMNDELYKLWGDYRAFSECERINS